MEIPTRFTHAFVAALLTLLPVSAYAMPHTSPTMATGHVRTIFMKPMIVRASAKTPVAAHSARGATAPGNIAIPAASPATTTTSPGSAPAAIVTSSPISSNAADLPAKPDEGFRLRPVVVIDSHAGKDVLAVHHVSAARVAKWCEARLERADAETPHARPAAAAAHRPPLRTSVDGH